MKNSSTLLSKVFILFFCSMLTNVLSAQVKPPFNLPATIPVPEWVNHIDWSKPNIHTIDSCLELYANLDLSEKNHFDRNDNTEITMVYQTKSNEIKEEPYRVAYIRWRNEMAPFIKSDGRIEFDGTYYNKIFQQAIIKHNSSNKNNDLLEESKSNWTILGPIETFHSQNYGKACSQVNVYQLAISPSNPSVIYSVSETGTIFKSIDKGLKWISISDALPAIGSNSIIVDPKDENTVYCNANGYSLIKTTNSGSSWSLLSSYTGGGGERMAINPKNGRIFIIGSSSIYYSDNKGTSWIQSQGSTIVGDYYDIIINPVGLDTVYAVASSKNKSIIMLRSTDGGLNFAVITNGLSGIENAGSRFGISVSNSNIVYCIALGNTVGPKLLKSTDRGSTWNVTSSSTNLSLTGGGNTEGLDMSNGQGFYDLDIVVDPNNVNNVIVGTTTTYKSIDGGINFVPLGGYIGNFGIHPDIQCARVHGNDAYIATDGGVNYSSDFFSDIKNWSVRNNGLTGSDFWGFGQGWDEDIVVGGRYHNGNTAIYENYGLGNSLAMGGGEAATGHVFHGKARTVGFEDIGTYTIPLNFSGRIGPANTSNTMWPQNDYYGLFSSKLVIDPRYSNVFYLGKDSILWKTSNNGSSYITLHNFGIGNKVWRFDIARSNYNVMYLCANNGIYKTSDAGNIWIKLPFPTTYNFYNTDIVINPLNESEVYVCLAHNAAADKVFRSIDGGANWTNITGTALNNTTVAYLQFQGGTDGGVYAITSANYSATKVFYRDNTMSEWVDFSNGIPPNVYARCGGQIFYRDSKLRFAGSRGIWESPLYSKGAPVAQPMSDKKYIACARDTVEFFDYSMVDYLGASWLWNFPGASWVSDSTARNPKVLYPSIGSYSVTLKVTNSSNQSNTKTVNDMISFTADNCSPDTIAGKCLQMKGTNQTVNLGKVHINSNSFSMSCWIKPKGNQNSFAQILSHYGCPGSPNYGLGLGFTFSGYTPNLHLCYTDEMVNYSNYSGLICDSTQWNFVTLTYSPSGVIIYLNGIPATVNPNKMPVLDLSQSPFYVNADIHNQGGKYNGLIDEIKFYNYTLSQNEVREKMHLIQNNPQSETGLVKYFQFNKYDDVSESVYDALSGFKSDIPNVNITKSTVPVGLGSFDRKPLVNNSGQHSFPKADIDIFLPNEGVNPNGEMVAFHLNSNPDEKPDNRAIVPGYFIINNYGTNKLISNPDSIRFSNLNVNLPFYTPGNFKIFNRSAVAFGSSWGIEKDSAVSFRFNPGSSTLTFSSLNNISNYGQFVIVNKNEIPNNVIQNELEQNNVTEISEIYPNPTKEFCTLNITSKVSQTVVMSLSDIKGSIICKTYQEIQSGKSTILLKLPELTKGMYLLNIKLRNGNESTKKLLIN